MGRKPGKKFSIQIAFRLDPLMTDILKKEADRRDISLSTFIRAVLKDWIRRQEMASEQPENLQV